MKEKLLEKKNEIIVISIYLIIFGVLIFLMSALLKKEADIQFSVNSASNDYNRIKNKNLSEPELLEELAEIATKVEEAKGRLPENLRVQDVNEMLAEILKNNNVFSLSNCTIANKKSTSGYSYIEVSIKSIQGSYSQISNFLDSLNKYKVKIVVAQMDMARAGNDMSGTMKLVFYGQS